MGTFQVFVVGPAEASDAGIRQLAASMEQRYGLRAADLIPRLQAGRFRVKTGLDRATAETYARDLEAIGAVTAIEEGRATQASTPVPTASLPPAPLTSGARPGGSSLPPPLTARTTTFTSGLAAAFSGEVPAASLGALDHSELSLASLDGSDADRLPAPTASTPGLMPASFGPPAAPSATVPPPLRPVITDRFAPPDQQAVELAVELHTDELADRARRRTSMPPATAPAVVTGSVVPPPAALAPSSKRPALTTAAEPGGAVLTTRAAPRWRLLAGVAIAIVLGFIPAHVVGGMRERAKYGAIDRNLAAAQAAALTQDDHDALDTLRYTALEQKRGARTGIIFTALLVWAAAGAAIAYVWFRRVPWDDRSGPA